MVLKPKQRTERRNERTSNRKPLSRPGGNRPARKGLTHHRKRALVGESEMTPSSVGSERRSRVNEPRKKDERGSLRACDSGDNTEAPLWSGVEVRPGSKSTAEPQRGLQGSWESLLSPRRNAGSGPHRLNKVQDRRRAFGLRSPRKRERTEVWSAEFNAKAQETDRGSLSISIVALESGVTHPKEPASSEGGCRDVELSLETHVGLSAHVNVSHVRRWIVLGANPQLRGTGCVNRARPVLWGASSGLRAGRPYPGPRSAGRKALWCRSAIELLKECPGGLELREDLEGTFGGGARFLSAAQLGQDRRSGVGDARVAGVGVFS